MWYKIIRRETRKKVAKSLEQTSGIEAIGVVYISTNSFRSSSRRGGSTEATLIAAAIAAETAIKIQFSCSWLKKSGTIHTIFCLFHCIRPNLLRLIYVFRINKKELMVSPMLWTRFFPLHSFLSRSLLVWWVFFGRWIQSTSDSWSVRRIFIHFCYKRACESNYTVQYW